VIFMILLSNWLTVLEVSCGHVLLSKQVGKKRWIESRAEANTSQQLSTVPVLNPYLLLSLCLLKALLDQPLLPLLPHFVLCHDNLANLGSSGDYAGIEGLQGCLLLCLLAF
jgi:hypothetical protein